MSTIGNVTAMLVLVTGLPTGAAEVRVLSAVGMRQVMLELGPRFERDTGHKLAVEFDASGMIVKRLEAGEAVDVVMVARSGIDRLSKAGKLAGPATDLAASRVGAAVRKGAAKPDISTPEAFKQALLAARAISYPDPALGGSSGVHVAGVIERLGIAEALRSKTVLSSASSQDAPGYVVASGRADMALHQIQELMAVPGIEIIGPLPGDLQETFLFSAAIMARARDAAAARALVAFLGTPEARAVIKAKGMDPSTPLQLAPARQ